MAGVTRRQAENINACVVPMAQTICLIWAAAMKQWTSFFLFIFCRFVISRYTKNNNNLRTLVRWYVIAPAKYNILQFHRFRKLIQHFNWKKRVHRIGYKLKQFVFLHAPFFRWWLLVGGSVVFLCVSVDIPWHSCQATACSFCNRNYDTISILRNSRQQQRAARQRVATEATPAVHL